jgi:predicted enzyme related to lactoylglutathione lyase
MPGKLEQQNEVLKGTTMIYQPEQTARDGASISGVDLFGFIVNDPQGAIAYYRDVLCMVPTAIDELGRGAEFTLPDGATFGVWKAEDGQRAGGGVVFFAVDDVHGAVSRFRERGAKIADPIESPVCFLAFGEDFEGNGFVIHQRKSKD